MIHNQKLHKSVEKTVLKVFDFYNKTITFDPQYKNDGLYFFLTLTKTDSKIENFPEFIESIQLMRKDDEFSGLEEKLVGTYSSAANIGNLANCLRSFLFQLYKKNPHCNSSEIEVEYENFESFFYSKDLKKNDWTRLYNFSSESPEIDFSDGVRIKISIENNSNGIKDFNQTMSYASMTKSNFIIERTYLTKKIVNSSFIEEGKLYSKKEIDTIIKKEGPQTTDIFDTVISSLRLLKSSAAYRDHKVQSKLISFTPHGGTTTTSPFFENIVIGEKCDLKNNETEELIEIYHYLKNEKDSRFGVAIRRLTSGIERKNIEDKLIDYMIGLETLYLPDGTAELSFRLSLRVAFLLFSKASERKVTYEFLRNIYDIRSKIVHGKQYKLTNENVLKVEDLLRTSLKLWIKNKNSFLSKIESNGSTIDGKLNSIFFE